MIVMIGANEEADNAFDAPLPQSSFHVQGFQFLINAFVSKDTHFYHSKVDNVCKEGRHGILITVVQVH